uniref:TIL domain-containing protein n=1 Tax=Meloidogyne incognita TaxID=6306 RepID=A0A914N9J4_MELIC
MQATIDCGQDETPQECGCDGTCDNPDPICIQSCENEPKCLCKEGFVRDGNNDCIKKSGCP